MSDELPGWAARFFGECCTHFERRWKGGSYSSSCSYSSRDQNVTVEFKTDTWKASATVSLEQCEHVAVDHAGLVIEYIVRQLEVNSV